MDNSKNSLVFVTKTCHSSLSSELFGGTNLMHGGLVKDLDVLGDTNFCSRCNRWDNDDRPT